MSYIVTAEERSYSLEEKDRTKSVLQNLALLLATTQGSVPMYRDFGLPVDVIDLPIPAAKARLSVAIKEMVEVYEPRAEIVNIRFDESGAMAGKLAPILEVNIKNEEQ